MKIIQAIQKYLVRAPLAFTLSGIFFIGSFLSPSVMDKIALHTDALSDITQWYTLITYSIPQSGFASWCWQATLLISAGICVERRIRRSYLIFMITTFVITGGVLFCSFPNLSDVCIGPGMVIYVYLGCLLASYIADRRNFSITEKIITAILLVVEFLSLITDIRNSILWGSALLADQLAFFVTLIVSLVLYKKIANQRVDLTR